MHGKCQITTGKILTQTRHKWRKVQSNKGTINYGKVNVQVQRVEEWLEHRAIIVSLHKQERKPKHIYKYNHFSTAYSELSIATSHGEYWSGLITFYTRNYMRINFCQYLWGYFLVIYKVQLANLLTENIYGPFLYSFMYSNAQITNSRNL